MIWDYRIRYNKQAILLTTYQFASFKLFMDSILD